MPSRFSILAFWCGCSTLSKIILTENTISTAAARLIRAYLPPGLSLFARMSLSQKKRCGTIIISAHTSGLRLFKNPSASICASRGMKHISTVAAMAVRIHTRLRFWTNLIMQHTLKAHTRAARGERAIVMTNIAISPIPSSITHPARPSI